MLDDKQIKFRLYKQDDLEFVCATFLRGLYYGNSFYGRIEKRTFFKEYTPVLFKLIENSIIEVACLADDDDIILGYSMIADSGAACLHWVYVKEAFRGLGIGSRLSHKGDIFLVSHLTDKFMKSNLTFNPFVL